MMIMAEGRKIFYRTLNNFRSSEHANKLIKTCFIYFANLLADEGLIRADSLFIDGTKIEADANRYTFVCRKAEEKYHARLKEDAVKLYEEINRQGNGKRRSSDKYRTRITGPADRERN